MLKKSFFKFLTVSIAAVLMLTSLQPQTANANQEIYTLTLEEDQLLTELMNVIDELDSKVDLQNLEQNTLDTLNTLSPEASELYNLYQDIATEAKDKGEQQVINETIEGVYEQETKNENALANANISPALYLPPLLKETKYKFSNKQVKWVLNRAEDLGLGGLFLAALAKYFGKAKTAHSLMIGFILAASAVTLKRCNSKNKGVTITKLRVGAGHHFFCETR